MKTSSLLLVPLLAASQICLAEEKPALQPSESSQPLPVPAALAKPPLFGGKKLKEVNFEQVKLGDLVGYLQKEAVSGDGDSLNVIVSPDTQELMIPSLRLRNLTASEALTIATTVLGLRLQPVMGDDGSKVVAWIIAPPVAHSTNAAAESPFTTSGVASATRRQELGNAGSRGMILDTSPAPSTGRSEALLQADRTFNPKAKVVPAGAALEFLALGAAADSPRQAKVFGIASLLPPPAKSPEEKLAREEKFNGLLIDLQKLAQDQDREAEIRPYPKLDLIVVKSTAMPMLSDAIEEMKRNVRDTATPSTHSSPTSQSGIPAIRVTEQPSPAPSRAVTPEKAH